MISNLRILLSLAMMMCGLLCYSRQAMELNELEKLIDEFPGEVGITDCQHCRVMP
ncbi:MAG: hypothetical protein KBT10_07160 [Bacteroidales bacterium]|nr:hypothetical protein [Candidatus Sodaliphilus aphodohippi]